MAPSNECLTLIETFEGFKEKAYKCPAGIWTIGYGTTKGVKPSDVITEEAASERLRKEVQEFALQVSSLIGPDTTQNQFDALVSFAYNLGISALASSTLLKKHLAKDYTAASVEFMKWDKAKINGKLTPLAGLTKRRQHESALYNKG